MIDANQKENEKKKKTNEKKNAWHTIGTQFCKNSPILKLS